jgi:hypothetical protein
MLFWTGIDVAVPRDSRLWASKRLSTVRLMMGLAS